MEETSPKFKLRVARISSIGAILSLAMAISLGALLKRFVDNGLVYEPDAWDIMLCTGIVLLFGTMLCGSAWCARLAYDARIAYLTGGDLPEYITGPRRKSR